MPRLQRHPPWIGDFVLWPRPLEGQDDPQAWLDQGHVGRNLDQNRAPESWLQRTAWRAQDPVRWRQLDGALLEVDVATDPL